MINELKEAPFILKLIAFVGIPIAALFACGTVGAVIYLTITQDSNSPTVAVQQTVSNAPFETIATATPEPPPPTNAPKPVLALPTAIETLEASPTPTPVVSPTDPTESVANILMEPAAITPGAPTATPVDAGITDLNYIQGKAAYEAGDYEEAIKLLNLALEMNPTVASAHLYLGMTYIELDDANRSLDHLEQALVLDPDYAKVYVNRGRVYYWFWGDEKRAIADWQKALSLDPTFTTAYNNIGIVHFNSNRYTLILPELEKSLAIDPFRADTWEIRGRTLYKLGQYKACVNSHSKAIELDPNFDVGIYYSRGVCYSFSGQHQAAIADYDVYLNEVPDDPRAWWNRGHSYRFLGNQDQAEADIKKAFEVDPTFSPP